MTTNATNPRTSAALSRTIRRQRLTIAGLAAAIALLAGLGHAPTQPDLSPPQITHYTAGGDRLYRIRDDGTIEYLIVDFANGSVEGIPGWARVHIDNSLTRDRMGNMTRVPGR